MTISPPMVPPVSGSLLASTPVAAATFRSPEPSPMNLTPITTPVALTEETTAPEESRQICAMESGVAPPASTSSLAAGVPVEIPTSPVPVTRNLSA